MYTQPVTVLDFQERFWSKVLQAGSDDCWPWIPNPTRNGYGSFGLRGIQMEAGRKIVKIGAHRMAFILANGREPEGSVDHECHNRDTSCEGGWSCPHRRCCNPAHLSDVSQRANLLRTANTIPGRFAQRTHCANNHEFTPENTRWYRGYRDCRACGRERQAKRRRTKS